MLKKSLRQFSKWGLIITAALVVAPLATVVEAAKKLPGQITADPSRAIWGRPVTLTGEPPAGPGMAPSGNATFFDNCDEGKRKALGTVPFVNNVAQLRTTADKLHLGPNDIGFSYPAIDNVPVFVCSPNLITVLPVAR